jgi:hypothetical protein
MSVGELENRVLRHRGKTIGAVHGGAIAHSSFSDCEPHQFSVSLDLGERHQ